MYNELNAYSIELYLGEVRSGKTLAMTAETYEETKGKNIKIYANYHLNKKYFPTFQFIDKKEIDLCYTKKEIYKNCIFLFDEAHTIIDSRQFMKDGNQKLGYFIGQMGKRGNVLRCNTHFPRLVDFRLRAYCERWVYCRKGLLKKGNIWKPILNNNRKLSDLENEQLEIKCSPFIRKLIDFEFYKVKEDKFYIHAKDYFDMYDTQELITA